MDLQLEDSGNEHSLGGIHPYHSLETAPLRRRPKEKEAAIESLWLECKSNAPFPIVRANKGPCMLELSCAAKSLEL